MSEITFITGNAAKAEQVAFYLSQPLAHRKIDLPEIQSLDLEEIVRDKAARAYAEVGSAVLVEDVSLTFPALGRLPGPLVKWFLGEIENEGLCRLVDGKDRTAIATVMFALHDENGCQTFSGETRGSVAIHPRGTLSFGWSPLFIPEGSERTWGEMTIEEQEATSMRKMALTKVHAHISGHSAKRATT